MSRFLVYTRLQIKRVVQYLPFVFLVTLLIALCLALAVTTMVNANRSDSDQTKIGLGIVGDFEDSYLTMGLSAVKSFDSSRFFLDVISLDDQSARQKLLDGEIAGYVVIPDGFIHDALYGDVGTLSFFTTADNAEIVNVFKQEVLKLISCVIVETQNGIYGAQDVMWDHDLDYNAINEMANKMRLEYVKLIINRSNALDVEIIGISDHLTFGGYIFSGLCVLLILLSGIVCCPLFIRRDYAFPKLLSANRYGAFSQTLSEYLAYLIVFTVNTSVLLIIMMTALGGGAGVITELSGRTVGDFIIVCVKFMPAIALITAMQYLLYQLSDSVVSGVMIQFVSAVIIGYVCGCFYPINFFPKAVRVVSDFLPAGLARGYLSSLITDSPSALQLISILVYTAVLLALGTAVRHYRIRKA